MSARPDLQLHYSVTDGRGDLVGEDHHSASRRDAYAYLGWVECGECNGRGSFCSRDCQDETNDCPDCFKGLVPSGAMMKAAETFVWTVNPLVAAARVGSE